MLYPQSMLGTLPDGQSRVHLLESYQRIDEQEIDAQPQAASCSQGPSSVATDALDWDRQTRRVLGRPRICDASVACAVQTSRT
jgi:hypothetical protein